MKIIVSGLGIISGIGLNEKETLHSLSAEESGIGPITLFETRHKESTPVAEVKASNAQLKDLLGLPTGKIYSRTALLGMFAAKQAYEDAHLKEKKKIRIGLISGTSVGGMDLSEIFYTSFYQDPKKGRLCRIVSHDCADSTERIASYLGISDHISTISTACSSAANAIMLGARLIRHNIVDCVIAGGTDALCKFTLNGFASLKILDNVHCRPMDESRTGLNLGEGAAYIVLEKESTHPVKNYCELTGYANVCEAFHQTASSPDGNGAFLAMKQALKKSNLSAHHIDYINLHGTGTPNNDLAEGNAVKRLFTNKKPFLSSTKAFTGHTLGAAGGIEAVMSVLAIKHQLLPPNLNFSTPISEHGLIPVTKFQQNVPINSVLSNSFGFGGNNSTLIFSKQ